ncbi:MAG: hypothetical protein JOZ96_11710 [Acidobacteria bacterium]|nr:hypothetical protein [Acidobacteriota bacterium]
MADPAAHLRNDGKSYYVAVKADPALWDGKDGKGARVVSPYDLTKQIVASVFQKGRQVANVVELADSYGSDFILRLPDSALADGVSALTVAVQSYPVGEGRMSGFTSSVSNEVSATVELKGRAACPAGFPLLVQFSDADVMTPYGLQRIKDLRDYMEKTRPAVQVESNTGKEAKPRDVKTQTKFFTDPDKDSGGRFFQCLELTDEPPSGTFDIEFKYPETAPIELRRPFLSKDVANAAHTLAPFTVDESQVGKRKLEQNLDASFQFGSSVEDKKEKNAAGVEEPVRKRNSKGTLDLRLAPFLNVLSLPDPGEKTFKFYTPLLIDARISTGKINEDTLALNRIILGSEYEIRRFTNPSTYPSYQRYIFSFRNASDRDFKQAEWKGGFEFQPVISALNRPLRFRRKSVNPILDKDPERAPRDVPTTIGFGGQVLPLIGVEAGKTWRNKHTFAAIEKTTFVRRFYFGGTINLDLTAYVKVSVKDVLYVRGEAQDDDPLHNYFKGTIEVPFPAITRRSASSAFFSFERGGEPPFATPDVNAVKIGYRVQWDGWFGQRR